MFGKGEIISKNNKKMILIVFFLCLKTIYVFIKDNFKDCHTFIISILNQNNDLPCFVIFMI